MARLDVPEPWRGNVVASLELIDDLERQIADANRRLRAGHADHPYVPLLLRRPGIGWVLAFTIAAEIGEIERFASPEKLTGYTGLCPRVNQSGDKDRRGPLTKHGPTYLRWALIEATMHALKPPRLRRALSADQEATGPPFDLRGNRGDWIEPATARPPAECAYPQIETQPGAAHACPYV